MTTVIHHRITRVWQRIYNLIVDLRFGAPLYGSVPTKYEHLGAHSTENSSYDSLEVLFKDKIRESDVLVDVGCGKGRVINWWLSKGLRNRLVGIELDPDVARKTRDRLRQFSNVQILTGNAAEQLPLDSTILYLYNPFGAQVMHDLKHRLKEILANGKTDKIRLIYLNCKCLDVFSSDEQCSIRTGHVSHPFAIIEMRAG
jgi:SAM-dependent methyltransferase